MNINRLVTTVVLCTFSLASSADIPVPANVDRELVSPTEDYHFYIDNDPASSDYYSTFKAFFDVFSLDRTGDWSIGNPQGYHHGYELLGFGEPSFNGLERNVNFWDCSPDGCDNGFATAGQILMPAPLYAGVSNSCTRMVLGHELFHHIQFGYKDIGAHSLGSWVTEGHARAMQDKIYTDLDTDPAASCVAPYLGAVTSYLAGGSPQHQLSIWNTSYRAALWWTYLMEQFGNATDEPIYGADFLTAWYENAVDNGSAGNSFATTNDTIQQFQPSTNFLATFRRFVLANIIKDMDLNGVSASFRRVYSYLDEQPNGPIDQDQYAQVKFTNSLVVSNASSTDTVLFGAEAYGSQYFDIDLSQCATGRLVRVSFNPAAADPFFGQPLQQLGAWGLVVGQSSDGSGDIETLHPAKYYKKLDEDWSVKFVQGTNPYDRAFATTTAVLGPMLGELTVECDTVTTIGPRLPLLNPINPQTPGPPDVLAYGEVCAVPIEPIPGLDPTDYEVTVDDKSVLVLAAEPRDDGHCLQIEIPPNEPGDPTQDIAVSLGGQTATVANAIVRNDPAPNVLVAIDTSSTMLLPPNQSKLTDVKSAVSDFARQLLPIDSRRALPKIGLIDFADDAMVVGPLVPADVVGLSRFQIVLDGLSSGANRFTSVGDAVQTIIDEFAARGDANQTKHAVLLFDGGQSPAGTSWANVEAAARASGIVFHVLALGAATDQPLAYAIARATGGRYGYVPVEPAGPDHIALAEEMAALAAAITGRTGIAEHVVQLNETNLEFTFGVPPQTTGLLLPAVQAVREAAGDGGTVIGDLTLIGPDDSKYEITLADLVITSHQMGGRGGEILPEGIWRMQFAPAQNARGELQLSVFAKRPVPLSAAANVASPAAAAVGSGQTISVGASRSISVTAFDGCGLRDDCVSGQGGQPIITGRVFNDPSPFQILPELTEAGPPPVATMAEPPTVSLSLSYEKVRFSHAGSPSGFADDGPVQDAEGSYRVKVKFPWIYDGFTVNLIGSTSYAVNSSIPTQDPDSDGLPSQYEDQQHCLNSAIADASIDQDNDGLPTISEFNAGTNPCDADTDRGGEMDGSELRAGRDPLLGTDDALPGIAFLQIVHEITHVEQQRKIAPNTIVMQYANSPKYANLTLKRGIPTRRGDSIFDVLIELDATSLGEYEDTRVVPGTEYCYQLEPFDEFGNAGRPSEIVCAVAAADPALPWGDLTINGGRPRTQDPSLKLEVGLYNKPTTTSEMLITVDGVSSGWIAYENGYAAVVATSTEPRTIFATVQLRDVEGNQSPVYPESIELWPAQSLGSITGRVILEGVSAGSRPGLAGVYVYLDDQSEPPAYTDSNGQFWFDELILGEKTLSVGRDGWNGLTAFATVAVQADETKDVGQYTLAIGSERLLADGFEN